MDAKEMRAFIAELKADTEVRAMQITVLHDRARRQWVQGNTQDAMREWAQIMALYANANDALKTAYLMLDSIKVD
jgi:hypothetical protein